MTSTGQDRLHSRAILSVAHNSFAFIPSPAVFP